MTHKEMTAHIRKCLKAQGVPARVRMFTACGQRYIQVFGKNYDARFTSEQIRAIAICASANRLTGAQGSEIDPSHEAKLTGKQQWSFEFRA